MTVACPICELHQATRSPSGAAEFFDCLRCGPFEFTGSSYQELQNGFYSLSPRTRAALCHHIRRASRGGKRVRLDSYNLPRILEGLHSPRASERADYLIEFLGETTEPGQIVELTSEEHGGIVASLDDGPFEFVLEGLSAEGQLELAEGIRRPWEARLTFGGWERFEELVRGKLLMRRAFMAMQFDEPEVERALTECFKPAAMRAGFDLFKLSDQPRAGLIELRMQVEIRTSRFVIVDLTHANLGAYWEAGFAVGLGRPVFYTCEAGWFWEHGTHFDTSHFHTVLWDATNLRAAENEVATLIRAELPDEAKLED